MTLAPEAGPLIPEIEEAKGLPPTVSGNPATAAFSVPFENASSTDDNAATVPVPITMVTDVALTQTGDVAGLPELGGAPTLALNPELMKLVPDTEIVQPISENKGDMEVADGLS
jgi:hypothetical protein